eukprot:3874259-Pyramimonas_sp.AAC.1
MHAKRSLYARMRQRADAASGKHHSYKESRRFRQDGLMVHTSYEHCGAWLNILMGRAVGELEGKDILRQR